MAGHRTPKIAVGPDPVPDWLVEAVHDGGGEVVPLVDAEGIVWADVSDAGGLSDAVAAARDATWVQLPWAGVETFVDVLDHDHVWTCVKGAYSDPVAEIALAL